MPFWKLVLEYEGTDFAGWQVQPDARTVQGELNRALSTVLRETVRVTGAGRTDAGVHALGQVASFSSEVDVAASLRSINAVLPDDVIVREAVAARDDFHARRDAVRRHYRYRLHPGPTALERRTCLVVRPWPDLEAMREGARHLPGSRDFVSFASSPEPGESTHCVLERVDIIEEGSTWNVEVTANRFLRKMVRTLVGTLLEVGWGNRPPEWIRDVIQARDRREAGPVIAPQGLFLVRVDYPGEGTGMEESA
ncbi:MAG TPA: tRNA pseudouridine(38-40) synthase TruA [bacterium]|nr:tRNA pseudouridine(38-40) synthase TruA [bacterium]